MSTELNPAQISELLARSKSRGEYDAELKEFLNSGKAGVEISLTEGRFAGKDAGQVQVGFNNARKKTNDQGLIHPGGPNVQVVAIKKTEKNKDVDEKVFLINKALVGGDTATAPAEDAA